MANARLKLLTLALLAALLGGVVITVGVAWTCAALVDVARAGPRSDFRLERGRWLRLERWRLPGAVHVGATSLRGETLRAVPMGDVDPPGWQVGELRDLGPDDGTATRLADGRGWPFIALWQRCEQPLVLPDLPLRPAWPGFAADVGVYAAALLLLIGTAVLLDRVRRRVLRLQRGRCPACAYPIGTSERCSECGQVLPTNGPS